MQAEDEQYLEELSSRADNIIDPDRYLPPSIPESVYHYTSLSAATAILTSQAVWCSNVQYSNDPAEVSYGRCLTGEIVKSKLPRETAADVLEISESYDYYVAAFSAHRDALPQWRAYGDGGRGAAIGVATVILKRAGLTSFGRVRYDAEEQRTATDRLIDTFAPALATYKRHSVQYRMFAGRLSVMLAHLNVLFKATSYGSEEECRLYRVSGADFETDIPQLRFRSGFGVLIPYFEQQFLRTTDAEPHPFTEVVLGPCVDHDRTRYALELLLRREGISNISLRRSTVQMRS